MADEIVAGMMVLFANFKEGAISYFDVGDLGLTYESGGLRVRWLSPAGDSDPIDSQGFIRQSNTERVVPYISPLTQDEAAHHNRWAEVHNDS